MSNKARHSIEPSAGEDIPTTRDMAKQEFGRKLLALLQEKGWNQSDLARAADMGRDNISCYVRGRTLPDPKSLAKVAKALGVKPQDLLPYSLVQTAETEVPAMEIRQIQGHPDRIMVRLNKIMTLKQAAAIFDIVNGRE